MILFQNFSLELKPGQVTALVGPSGEGKSTCASLLERFYEPQDGKILLDSEPLKSYDHRYLHKKVINDLSFLSSCIYLFHIFKYNISIQQSCRKTYIVNVAGVPF